MAFDVGAAVAKIKMDTSGYRKGVKEVEGSNKKVKGNVGSVGQSLTNLAGKLKLAGVAAASAFAAFEFKQAVDFEQKLSNINTLLSGESQESIDQFKNGILDMTKTIPKDANELGAAAYDIVSAGISDTAQALRVLEASGKLAVAGLGNTKEATDLMTSAINAFNIPAERADEVANVLFETVKNGKTTVSELAQAFGNAAPTLSAAGVQFEEFQAATAALTTSGQKASVAQMGLRQAVVSLQKPTKEMSELFEKIGVENGEVAIQQFGLVGTMDKLKEATDGNNDTLSRAFGSVEAFNSVLALTGPNADAFRKTLEDLTDEANSMEEAFEKQKQTVGNTFKLIRNAAERYIVKGLFVVFEWLRENGPAILERLKQAWDVVEPSVKALFNTVKNDLFPALQRLWREVIEPLVPVLAVTLFGGFMIAIDAVNALIAVLSPLIGFFSQNKEIAIAFGVALGGPMVVGKILGFASAITSTAMGAVKGMSSFIKNPSNLISPWGLISAAAVGAFLVINARANDTIQKLNEIADASDNTTEHMRSLKGQFDEGAISAEEYSKQLKNAALKTSELASTAQMERERLEGAGGFVNWVFGGFRAEGGPVLPNESYVVGEKGPELFMPTSKGEIISNDTLKNVQDSVSNVNNKISTNIGTVNISPGVNGMDAMRQITRDDELAQLGLVGM